MKEKFVGRGLALIKRVLLGCHEVDPCTCSGEMLRPNEGLVEIWEAFKRTSQLRSALNSSLLQHHSAYDAMNIRAFAKKKNITVLFL
jgi:hypothetical protein